MKCLAPHFQGLQTLSWKHAIIQQARLWDTNGFGTRNTSILTAREDSSPGRRELWPGGGWWSWEEENWSSGRREMRPGVNGGPVSPLLLWVSSPRSQQLGRAKSREPQKLGLVQHLIILSISCLSPIKMLHVEIFIISAMLLMCVFYIKYIKQTQFIFFVFTKIIPKYFMLYGKRIAISLKKSWWIF